jgi:hypothetical protein
MPDIPDLICHYHFLENVGTRLCEKHHAKIIACLRRLKIRPILCSLRHDLVRRAKQKGGLTSAQIEVLLEGPEQAANVDPARKRWTLAYLILSWLEDYGSELGGVFPVRPPGLTLYRRYCTVHDWLLRIMAAVDSPNRAFPHWRRFTITWPQSWKIRNWWGRRALEKAAALFNELRDVLRLGSDGPHLLLHQRPVADGPVLAARGRSTFRSGPIS